ncbi:hypothetical protein ILYODFUR_005855 [Ilyodon furcidens]|uniref:Uncharacterized protein n=1 Tax=Ilyodon furcidens TaxID=33524 RepID=A0ABV0VBY4_9TELE
MFPNNYLDGFTGTAHPVSHRSSCETLLLHRYMFISTAVSSGGAPPTGRSSANELLAASDPLHVWIQRRAKEV